MSDQITKIITDIQNDRLDYNETCAFIIRMAQNGESKLLYDLMTKLETAENIPYDIHLDGLIYVGGLISKIEYAVATMQHPSVIKQIFEFAYLPRQNSLSRELYVPNRLRYFASRLVLNHPSEIVINAIEEFENEIKYESFLYLLVQEFAIIKDLADTIPILTRLYHRMCKIRHPLAWLPAHSTEFESFLTDLFDAKAYSPSLDGNVNQYSVYHSHIRFPWGPFYAKENPYDKKTYAEFRHSKQIYEATSVDDMMRTPVAAMNWAMESNGKWEAKTFFINPPVQGDEVNKYLIFSLELDCLRSTRNLASDTQVDRLYWEIISPEKVFALLFRVAANGGDLNEGYFGAYGRLYAWRSLAGLCNASDYADINQVIKVAKQSIWIFFSCPSSWFYGVVSEFGLVCIRPDRQSIAVLAATDTD